MTAAMLDDSQDVASVANRYLTFTLGGEEYGLEILKVQEIKGLIAIKRMPNTPTHVKGVANLRGTLVPILDLRARFGLEERPYDRFTVFIIAHVGHKLVGLVVDAVEEVIDIAPEAIQPAPDLAGSDAAPFIRGITQADDRVIAVLDIERIVRNDLGMPDPA
jgi:purine-binding chemotaxis protein CheW